MYALLAVMAIAMTPAFVLGDNKFTEPGPAGKSGDYQKNPVYDIGDQVNLEWEADFKNMDVYILQNYPLGSDGSQQLLKIEDATNYTSTIWTVDTNGFNTDVAKGEDLVFYLALYQNQVDNVRAYSHYFNVSLDSSETTTATATASETLSTMTSATESSASAETSTTSSSAGLSTGAIAGIAVGATIGGLALLAGLGFLIFRKRQKKQSPLGTPETSQTAPPYSPPQGHDVKYEPVGPAEVSAEETRHELHGQGYSSNVPGLYEAP
ncbi:hypothetical protein ACHAP8_007570 [Fusarium lateritium]